MAFITRMSKTPLFRVLSLGPVLLGACLMVRPVWAQNFLSSDQKDVTPSTSFQPQIQFEVQQLNYTSESAYDHSSQQKVELNLGHQQKGFIFSESDLYVGTYSEPKSFYAAAPSLYVGVGDRQASYVAVGRLKRGFNFLDSYYNMGLYNSYFTNDYIDYKEQGLTGVHMQAYNGLVGIYAGWQALYLPNQEPQVHEDGGSLVSSNRWALRPPKQFQFADVNHPVIYAIRDYNIDEIITHQGGTASIFLGDKVERPWLQLSYANHPLNEVPLTRDTYGSAMDFVGHVALSPVVTYQEVKSVDANFDFKNIQTTLSYAEDRVQNKTAAENETLQNLKPMQVYGAYVAADLSPWVRRQLVLSLAAAEIKGGDIVDISSDGKESVFNISNRRTPFKAPVTLGVATELAFIRSKPLKSQVRWTYDRTYKGSLLSAQFDYEILARMNLQLGADIVGVEEQLPEDATSNFFQDNRANDRVYGGLTYAF